MTYDEALGIIERTITRTTPAETVPLVLSAGRVLAEPVVADEAIPPHRNSAMDGYAVIAADVAGASVESPALLPVIGEASAGRPFDGTALPGCAIRISTGAIVPGGADAVVEVESTEERDQVVQVRRAVAPGASVREAGEDLRIGDVAIPGGRWIGPGEIGVLASLGITSVPVRVQPKVGILSTGDELVEAGKNPAFGQIRNSSGPALYAAAAAAGAEPIDLGIAPDNEEALLEWLELGLRYDILITTGGVSAGPHDLVQHLLPALGVEVLFHRVEIKPGRPVLFGVMRSDGTETLVFGLPGNPVSSLLGHQIFVAPTIARMMGTVNAPLKLRAQLADSIRKRDGRRHFVRGIVARESGGVLVVSTTGTQSSGALSSMSRANCIIEIPEDQLELARGADVDLWLLRDR